MRIRSWRVLPHPVWDGFAPCPGGLGSCISNRVRTERALFTGGKSGALGEAEGTSRGENAGRPRSKRLLTLAIRTERDPVDCPLTLPSRPRGERTEVRAGGSRLFHYICKVQEIAVFEGTEDGPGKSKPRARPDSGGDCGMRVRRSRSHRRIRPMLPAAEAPETGVHGTPLGLPSHAGWFTLPV